MANTNKGTREGTEAELEFVKHANIDKSLNNPIWNLLNFKLSFNGDLEDLHIVRVTSKVYSSIQDKKILPKADAYVVKGKIPHEYVESLDYKLTESDVENFDLKFIPFSGISIKRPDSKKFQILKMSPNSFCKIIGNYVLGAGASIYCLKEAEIEKNNSVLNGWHTTWQEFKDYFKNIENISLIDSDELSNSEKLGILKQVKNISNDCIKNIIQNDISKLYMVFKGTGMFEEPYPAYFLFKEGIFTMNEPFEFRVTTGSGRSKGDFTIVLKP